MSKIKANITGRRKALTPTLYIGVGGTGLETLKALKKINTDTYGENLPVVRYLSIDTRDNLEKLRPLDDTEQLDLSTDPEVRNMGEVLTKLEQHYPRILSWLPDTTKWAKFKNITQILEGADQCRALGRLIFNLAAGNKVIPAIDDVLSSITADRAAAIVGESNELQINYGHGPDIFIVGSICGGTGSGMFLDLAYLCRHLGRSNGRTALKVYGVLGLPNLFPTSNVRSIQANTANAYAALKELNHYTDSMNYQMDYGNVSVEAANTPPFDQCFFLDSPNEKGVTFDRRDGKKSFDTAIKMIANGIFCLSTSPTESSYAEYITNQLSGQSVRIKNNAGTEYPAAFNSFGVASLAFPFNGYRDYCTYTLMGDVITKLKEDRGLNDKELIEEKGIEFISTFSLPTERVKMDLSKNIDLYFSNWFNMAKETLISNKGNKPAVDENALINAIKAERNSIESELSTLKQRIKKNARVVKSGVSLDNIEPFFRKLVNNSEEFGIKSAIKVLEFIRKSLQAGIESFDNDSKEELESNKHNLEVYESITDESSVNENGVPLGELRRLVDQSFIKDLFDWDKKEELSNLTVRALNLLKEGANDALTAYLLQTSIDIYRHADSVLEEIGTRLTKIKNLLENIFPIIEERRQKTSIIPSKEGLTYNVLRDGVSNSCKAIYNEIFPKNTKNILTTIRKLFDDQPLYAWAEQFPQKDKLFDFLEKEVREETQSKLGDEQKFNIFSELEVTKATNEYVNGNIMPASAAYISTNRILDSNSRYLYLLATPEEIKVPTKDQKTSKNVKNLIRHGVECAEIEIGDPHSITLLTTKCFFPLCSLTKISEWKKQCDLIRNSNDNPCYSMKDEITASFKDITPDAKEAIGTYQRAVHAFDLGENLGFLAKKPKGRVYYFCTEADNIESGFPIKGRSGGRLKTKEWLADRENEPHLKELEQKIYATLSNMDNNGFAEFLKKWRIFQTKAVPKSKKDRLWQDGDGRPDYNPGAPFPAVIEKVKKMKDESRL